MRQQIQLTQGYIALVDSADYARVNQYKWQAHVARRRDGSIRNVYAVRKVRRPDGTWTAQQLHRFILGVTDPDVQVDHRDHDGLNNTRKNLRLANHADNNHNQRVRNDNTSGVKGVYRDKRIEKWLVRIQLNGKRKHIGYFTSIVDAASAYDAAALKYFGKFAYTNAMIEMKAA